MVRDNPGVGVDKTLKAHGVPQQSLEDGRIIGTGELLRLDQNTIHSLGFAAGIGSRTGVTGHDAGHACVDSRLEAHQLVLLQGALRAVNAPLTAYAVTGEPILSRAIAGEVLHDHGHIAGLYAIGTMLIAGNQSGDDLSHHLRILAISCGVPGPAGVGDQVNLGAVHLVDALGVPDVGVNFRPFPKGVGISVAVNSCGKADLIGVAADHRIGDQHVGDGDLAIDGAHMLGQHVQGVVEQGAGLRIGILPDDAGTAIGVKYL